MLRHAPGHPLPRTSAGGAAVRALRSLRPASPRASRRSRHVRHRHHGGRHPCTRAGRPLGSGQDCGTAPGRGRTARCRHGNRRGRFRSSASPGPVPPARRPGLRCRDGRSLRLDQRHRERDAGGGAGRQRRLGAGGVPGLGRGPGLGVPASRTGAVRRRGGRRPATPGARGPAPVPGPARRRHGRHHGGGGRRRRPGRRAPGDAGTRCARRAVVGAEPPAQRRRRDGTSPRHPQRAHPGGRPLPDRHQHPAASGGRRALAVARRRSRGGAGGADALRAAHSATSRCTGSSRWPASRTRSPAT